MTMRVRAVATGSTVALALLMACHVVNKGDLSQYNRMLNEGALARANESVACSARDLVCARIVQMRGAACASIANDQQQSPERRAELRHCALDDARRLPDLLPTNAPEEDWDRAAFLDFDAWRAALDAGDPAADPATVAAAADQIASLQGGAPYAATLRAYAATIGVQTGRVPAASACDTLTMAERDLPGTPPPALVRTVANLRVALADTKRRSCR